MRKLMLALASIVTLGLLLLIDGCTKERIMESTEIVKDVQIITDTVVVVQTVTKHDTIRVVDTVQSVHCEPNELLAMAAMEYHTDPQVLDFINQEFGINDGWVFYLSTFQVDLVQASPAIYDIYGFIDYWTPDWSAYYPLEFYWRLSFTGGDPADPRDWQQSDPPAAVSGRAPGIGLVPENARKAMNR